MPFHLGGAAVKRFSRCAEAFPVELEEQFSFCVTFFIDREGKQCGNNLVNKVYKSILNQARHILSSFICIKMNIAAALNVILLKKS